MDKDCADELIVKVEYYPSGEVEFKSSHEPWSGRDLLAGPCTHYYKNGNKISEGGFIPGSYSPIDPDDYSFASMEPPKRHGLWTYWYENGQKKSQCLYSEGVRDGLYIGYYKNGQKKVEKIYKVVKEEVWEPYDVSKKMLSLKDGKAIVWKRDGTKKLELNYKCVVDICGLVKYKAMKDGVCIRWLEDGDKVTTRYVAYYSNYCIDSPRRRREYACDIFRRNV